MMARGRAGIEDAGAAHEADRISHIEYVRQVDAIQDRTALDLNTRCAEIANAWLNQA